MLSTAYQRGLPDFSGSTHGLEPDVASESLPLLLGKHPSLHACVRSSAKAELAFASTSADKASVQKAKPYRPSTAISPIHELSEVTLEISIHLSEFIPRPLLFLICQRNVDHAHQLCFDDLPVAGFVVLHQNLVCAFGTNRQY